jgi:hypothetical protein
MTFWTQNPSILFNSNYITQIWPYSYMNKDAKFNAITRFVILISLFGYMCMNKIIILILGIIIIGLIALMYNNKEGYISSYFKEYKKDEIKIKENNPFNNVLMSDYKYSNKGIIDENDSLLDDYTPEVENKLNESIKNSILEQNKDNSDMIYMFSDDKTNFEFEQNMRQFNSNPSTTIPNNQDKFVEFCYGKLYSEKPLTIY